MTIENFRVNKDNNGLSVCIVRKEKSNPLQLWIFVSNRITNAFELVQPNSSLASGHIQMDVDL